MNSPTVIFDMDGLLLDTEAICLDTFIETRRQYGLPDDRSVFIATIGLREREAEHVVRESLGDLVTFEDFGRHWDIRIAQRMAQSIPVKPGARQLLHALSRAGCKLAVATSTQTEKATRHLDRAGLLPYLDHVVGGDRVARGKPDPEVYHLAAGCLGRRADECFAFEDSDTGTRAAVSSGARTVQIPDLATPSEDVRRLGHLIAPNLLEGAVNIGLIQRSDLDAAFGLC